MFVGPRQTENRGLLVHDKKMKSILKRESYWGERRNDTCVIARRKRMVDYLANGKIAHVSQLPITVNC